MKSYDKQDLPEEASCPQHELDTQSEVAEDGKSQLYRRFRDENRQCLEGKLQLRIARLKARLGKVPGEAHLCKAPGDKGSSASGNGVSSDCRISSPHANRRLIESEPVPDAQDWPGTEGLKESMSTVEGNLIASNADVHRLLKKLTGSRREHWNQVTDTSIAERRISSLLAQRKTSEREDLSEEVIRCEEREKECSRLLCKAREQALLWAPIVARQQAYITHRKDKADLRRMCDRHPAGELFMASVFDQPAVSRLGRRALDVEGDEDDLGVADSGRVLVCDDSNDSVNSSGSSCDTDDLPLSWGETTYDQSRNRHLVPKLDLTLVNLEDSEGESGSEEESFLDAGGYQCQGYEYDEAMDIDAGSSGGFVDEAMGGDGTYGGADGLYYDELDEIVELDGSVEMPLGMLEGLENGRNRASKDMECSLPWRSGNSAAVQLDAHSSSASYEDDFEESSDYPQSVSHVSDDELR